MERHPRSHEELMGQLRSEVKQLTRWSTARSAFRPLTIPISALGLTGTLSLYLRDHVVYAAGELNGTLSGSGTLVTITDGDYFPFTPVKRTLGGSSLTATSSRLVSISTAGVIRIADHNGGSGLEFNSLSYLTS